MGAPWRTEGKCDGQSEEVSACPSSCPLTFDPCQSRPTPPPLQVLKLRPLRGTLLHLTLHGNPVLQDPAYRPTLLALLPRLRSLDFSPRAPSAPSASCRGPTSWFSSPFWVCGVITGGLGTLPGWFFSHFVCGGFQNTQNVVLATAHVWRICTP